MARARPAPRKPAPANNAEIAAALDEIADLLEIEEANPFRIRAYRNAARLVQGLASEAGAMLDRGEDLSQLEGIGKDLAGKIADLARTGRTEILDKLRRAVPPALTELLRLPGLGPKRVKALYDELDIHSVAQLHRAAKDGKLRLLPGFGAASEARILSAIERRAELGQRLKLASAAEFAEALVDHLKQAPGVEQVIVAGSYRRAKETVGDLDILAAAGRGNKAVEKFLAYPPVREVTAKGPTRASVVLRAGLQVDLRVVPPESWGAALHYFTGSKAHNIEIRRRGQARGLKINEYGVFRGRRRIGGATEREVFEAVGLPFIPPELRENRGEIEAAEAGRLPRLIESGDIRGDLHIHTTATDGAETPRVMALAAKKMGFAYIAITEHSRRLAMVHGLDERRLRRQGEAIDRLNEEGLGILILKGIEVDILEDGALDLPDAALGDLDLVIGAVHSRFQLSRERQTERVLRAMDRPHFTILAHPSGRLIPEREPYDIDMPRVIRHARERGCALELNAYPERLDLIDTHCRAAKEAGVQIAINTDAHSIADLANMRFGVAQARRGWLEKRDVLNTRPPAELRAFLARTMGRRA